jgi:hypothetical protein
MEKVNQVWITDMDLRERLYNWVYLYPYDQRIHVYSGSNGLLLQNCVRLAIKCIFLSRYLRKFFSVGEATDFQLRVWMSVHSYGF